MKYSMFILLILVSLKLSAQKVYTPQKGTPERTEILDIFREDFGEEKSQILFKVEHFLISGNWACAYVTPLKNNKEVGDPRWDLFQKINGSWKSVKWEENIEFQDDFEMIDFPQQNSRIAKEIVRNFPGCPMSIFGNQ
jgi:hypothetical protein